MQDAERWWAVVVGVAGLVALAGGSLLAQVPRVDAPIDEVMDTLQRRRASVLVGSVSSITGSALLLWPLSAVATAGPGEVWGSIALFSIATWVLGFGLLALGSLLVVAVVWRGGAVHEPSVAQVLFDAAHLAVWSVSAPIGAVSVVATTVVGLQADVVGPLVVAAAAVKVVTVVVEVIGTGQRRGWNAGGWAAGSSGVATVIWFACLILALT